MLATPAGRSTGGRGSDVSAPLAPATSVVATELSSGGFVVTGSVVAGPLVSVAGGVVGRVVDVGLTVSAPLAEFSASDDSAPSVDVGVTGGELVPV